eukprot:11982949-Alexandrium_andersonii.AAC.1
MLCNWGLPLQFPSDLGTSTLKSPNGRTPVRAEAPSARRILGVRGGRCTYTQIRRSITPPGYQDISLR